MGCYVQCHCPGWSSALCSFALDSIVDVKTRRQPCAPIVLYRATGLPKGRVVFKRLAGHHFCNRHFCLEGTFPVAVDTKRNLVRMKFFIPFVFLLGELSRPVNELSGHCERLRGQSYSIIASFRYKKKKKRSGNSPLHHFLLWYSTRKTAWRNVYPAVSSGVRWLFSSAFISSKSLSIQVLYELLHACPYPRRKGV